MTNPNVNTDISMDLLLRQGTKTKKRRWTGLIFSLLVVGGLAAGGWWYYNQQQQKAATISYETTAISKGNISVSINATGNLTPLNQVEIGTELSGTINEVLVEANDVVTKGQKLASLNTDQLEDAVTKARAALISARSKVTQAEAQVSQALAKNRQSAASVQQAVANAQQSAASATQAVNNIKQAEFALRQSNEGVQQANNGGAQINASLQQANANYRQVAAGVKQAEANLAKAYAAFHQANAGLQQANTNPQQSQAGLQQATAQYTQAKASTLEARIQLNRLLELKKKSGGKLPAQQEIDVATASWKRAVAAESSAQAGVQSARANGDSGKAGVSSAKAAVDSARAGVDAAKASVDAAKANLTAARAGVNSAKANIGNGKSKVTTAKTDVEAARLAVETAKTNASAAKANAAAAKANIDSVKASAESTEAETVSARANIEAAKASVMEAEANLRSAESNLAKAIIVSPINGVVLTRSVEPGQTVASSLSAPTLFTLAEDLKRMELDVAVDEADVAKVKEGQQGKFTVDAWPGRNYPASISRVSLGSTLNDNVVSYLTVLEVENADLSLRPGMTATAMITTSSKEDVLLVPNAALRFSPPRPEGTGAEAGARRAAGTGGTPAATESGGLLSKLMPQRRGGGRNRNANRGNRAGRQGGARAAGGQRPQRLWVLENGEPKRIRVETGISDGKMTEVNAEQLQEGMQIITASISGQAGAK